MTTTERRIGTDPATCVRERPGMSASVIDERHRLARLIRLCARAGRLWGMSRWLDRAPKGRNESGVWWRRLDEYA